jgi:hypothetical protein
MELIDHDTGLGQHSLDRCPVGVPHVHADDLDLLPVFHLHQVVGHHVLTAGGQQIEQGLLLDVGQDTAIALVQIQLVDAKNTGRLEAVPAPQELGTGVEDVAYRLLVQAGLGRHEGIGMVEGFLLHVLMQPQGHAEAIHHHR